MQKSCDRPVKKLKTVKDTEENGINSQCSLVSSSCDEEKWTKPEARVEDFQFEPHQFIRSHCNEDDDERERESVQIWDVEFEPGNPEVVATCGGRYLCVINIETGDLLLKYCHKMKSQDFFTLAWSEMNFGNILATGSNLGEIRLYHLAKEVSFYHWIYKKGVAINAAKFHHHIPNLLFTASSDSVVILWNIGSPVPPSYNGANHEQLLSLQASGDFYSMAWVPDSQWILVGAKDGLFGWNIKVETAKDRCSGSELFTNALPAKSAVIFKLPENRLCQFPYVDSVCSLGNNLVATKCVSRGRILIIQPPLSDQIDLSDGSQQKTKYCDVQVLMELAWRKTDNFYMNIGGSIKLGLVACGDDSGHVWVYKLPRSVCEADMNDNYVPAVKMAPLGILPWPRLDGDGSKSEEEDVSVNVMLDKVAISSSGDFIVAVTNNNLVAIWKKLNTE